MEHTFAFFEINNNGKYIYLYDKKYILQFEFELQLYYIHVSNV